MARAVDKADSILTLSSAL